MKKIYNLSRVILAILAFIIFNIMFINEDISWMPVTIVFSLITFGFSFPSTILCKKIIGIGNKIDNVFLKIIYYISLPVILIFICGVIGAVIVFISDMIPTQNNLADALGHALLTLFIIAVVAIGIMLPYIQSLIVLILTKIFKVTYEE